MTCALCAAVKLGVIDCIAQCIRLAIPQPIEWQRIGNEIDAAFVFARPDFVNVHHVKNSKQSPLYSGGTKIMRIN
jgi:hypothetical protein